MSSLLNAPVALTIICMIMVPYEAQEMIKVGVLFTSGRCCNYLSYEDKGSVLNIVIDQLEQDGLLNKSMVTYEFIWRDSFTTDMAVGDVITFILNDKVDAIFGSPQSTMTFATGHITTHFNIPQITWSSSMFELGNKTMFRTLARTTGPMSEVGNFVVTLFRQFDWSVAGLLYADRDICRYITTGVKRVFAVNNMTFTQTISYHEDTILTDDIIDDYLTRIRQTSRVIFFCKFWDVRPFLIRAYHLGMCNGEFAFIYAWIYPPTTTEWFQGDKDDEAAREAYKYLIHISVAAYKGESGKQRIDDFHTEVEARMSEPPWNVNTVPRNKAGNGVETLYETMYLYGMWINHTLTNPGVDRKDGMAWLKFTKNKSFAGVGGPVDIGMNGDKIPYFWVTRFIGENMTAVKVAESEDKNSKISFLREIQWATEDGHAPRDVPKCGFFGEMCSRLAIEDTSVVTIISILLALMFLIAVLVIGYVVRKRNLEKDLLQSIWKVSMTDIELQKHRPGMGSRINCKSCKSSMMSTLSIGPAGEENGNRFSQGRNWAAVNIAIYKNQAVAMKTVAKKGILSNEDLQDLKTMREFLHDNINPFMGVCFDTVTPFALFMYCSKGSLQDILENEEIQLDTNFKLSLTMDLINEQPIDAMNMIAKLELKTKLLLSGLLWTAPELLISPYDNPKGTKEGDVYSFSIILHEIFFRMGPFAVNDEMTLKDIVGRVRNRETVPYRPTVFTESAEMTHAVVKLMQLCWHDDKNERPTFSVIRSYFKKNVQNGESTNIVDVILQRLEKYASNLEELVDNRTQQLIQEKQKSDKLLYSMMPKTCADKLKAGEFVMPEMFAAASVFFSDIVGFTTIASMSSPMEVIDLLNDLYSCVDNIIKKYDAYKVETIGDAYLVVSGIPNSNGSLHAGIIADMSLEITREIGKFKIKHLPGQGICVRVGNHTGPCCAGIVGLTMPRYCIFGDTVNVASRMESTGAAKRIHLSEAFNIALEKLGGYTTEFEEQLEIKGKGLMNTYWLLGSVRHPISNLNSDD